MSPRTSVLNVAVFLALVGVCAPAARGWDAYTPPTGYSVNAPSKVCIGYPIPVTFTNGTDTDRNMDGKVSYWTADLTVENVRWSFQSRDGQRCSGTGSPPSFRQPGWVTILAAFCDESTPVNEGCYTGSKTVEVICKDCPQGGSQSANGGCGNAALSVLTPVTDVNGGGSVSASFLMGVTSDGKSAGVLYFDGKYPATSLWNRSNLCYSLEDNPPTEVKVVRDGGGLWQVGTNLVVADVGNVTHGYAIKYYVNDGNHVQWNGQSYDIDGNAVELYRHVVYSTVSTSATITGYVAGTATTSHVFSGQGGSTNWTLETGDYGVHAQQREQVTTALVSGKYQQTRTLQLWDGSQYRTTFQEVTKADIQGGPWKERIVDPGGGAAVLHTYRGYYDSGSSSGLLEYEQRPAGDWTYYEYDAQQRTSRITTPWQNQAFADPPTGNLRQTEYDYSPVDGYDDGTVDPYQPRRVDEKVSPEGSPTPVARTYYYREQ